MSTIVELVKPMLKSLAAFVAVWVAAFVLEKTGVDIDALSLETFLVSVLNAVTVWLVPNKPAEVSS